MKQEAQTETEPSKNEQESTPIDHSLRSIDPIELDKWNSILRVIQIMPDQAIWIDVDEHTEIWKLMKRMCQHGLVFPGRTQRNGLSLTWKKYEKSLDRVSAALRFVAQKSSEKENDVTQTTPAQSYLKAD